MTQIANFGELVKGTVIKRPSATCKTPYVADVLLENGVTILAHTASLGCCGLVDKGANILLLQSSNPKNKCSHKVVCSSFEEKERRIVVGVDPGLAESFVKSCLEQDLFSFITAKEVKTQQTYGNSRFDFAGTDSNNIPFILEVKNAPLADYEDIDSKTKKKLLLENPNIWSKRQVDSKISYFPDGYRKNAKSPVSPRACKHITELQGLVSPEQRCIMCYVVQRTDSLSFQPSVIDQHYKGLFEEAVCAGVEMYVIQIQWQEDGKVSFYSELEIND